MPIFFFCKYKCHKYMHSLELQTYGLTGCFQCRVAAVRCCQLISTLRIPGFDGSEGAPMAAARTQMIQTKKTKRENERNNQYVVFRSSYSQILSPSLTTKDRDGEVLVRVSPQRLQTALLTLCGRTVACLTELLSWREE